MAKLSAKEKAAIEFPKRLLSVLETASLMGVSARTIYNQTSRKSKKKFPIRPVRINGSIKFDIQDIDEFITRQKEV